MNFYTAYVDPLYPDPSNPRHLVISRQRICRRYLKGWFLIDILSVLPIGYINLMLDRGSSGGGNQTKIFKLFRLSRLTKLLRLARLKRLLAKYTEEFENMAFLFKLSATMAMLFAFGHLIACAFYYVGDTENGWVEVRFPVISASQEASVDEQIDVNRLHDQTPLTDKYLQCLWFALGVLLAPSYTPEIMPATRMEVVFISILIVVGAVVFAIVIGTVSTLLVSKQLLETKVDRQLAELKEYLQTKNVPKTLRYQIKQFMEKLYQARTGYDPTEVLESLPPALRNKLMDHMYRKLLLRMPMFRNCPSQVILELCLVIKPYTVIEDDVVFAQNMLAEEMYFVRSGKVQIMRYGLTLGILVEGGFFGQEGLLPGRHFREHTVTALTDCDLLFLKAMDVNQIAMKYPELIDNIHTAANRRAKKEEERLDQLIKESAQELGVEVGSRAMQEVLKAIETLSEDDSKSDRQVAQLRHDAVLTIQRHFRGRVARRRHKIHLVLSKMHNRSGNVHVDSHFKQMGMRILDAAHYAKSAVRLAKKTPSAVEVTVFEGRNFPCAWQVDACHPYVEAQVVSSDTDSANASKQGEMNIDPVDQQEKGGTNAKAYRAFQEGESVNSCASELARTTTQTATCDPSWGANGQSLCIDTGDLGASNNLRIVMKVFDENATAEDILIGMFVLPLNEVNACADQTVTKSYPLLGVDENQVRGNETGQPATLRVEIRALYRHISQDRDDRLEEEQQHTEMIKEVAGTMWRKMKSHAQVASAVSMSARRKDTTSASAEGGEHSPNSVHASSRPTEQPAVGSSKGTELPSVLEVPQHALPDEITAEMQHMVDRMDKLESMLSQVMESQSNLQTTLLNLPLVKDLTELQQTNEA